MKDTLENLFPQPVKFKFTKHDHEFTLGKIGLAESAWMLQEFGGKRGLEEVFLKNDIKSILRIVYRLLINEDKKFLTTQAEVELVDEMGEVTIVKNNVDKLLHMLEKEDGDVIVNALLRARKISMPIEDETTSTDGGEEKK